ncbi:uncharacterized protein AMSG_04354 [Thecamonas trahens ATCC 50062]|uniref:CID domain-containing protein n=1 Tax=Thecamonas trahens ATCC 50062 TaxID=461836 RepID=A0A0L0D7G0_THETB|nr:hypothetical protein AMSG_04354 [Thecamonas trahens ATCC 50062]KNC48125.1 hypothetical protein AMSG_04354 [Thecamonas trahens ATCC 50062]|eukprot:XP_013758696.1 hypothetical protein AMSG_04354 [Thecamonas trahens ATCC 50062]
MSDIDNEVRNSFRSALLDLRSIDVASVGAVQSLAGDLVDHAAVVLEVIVQHLKVCKPKYALPSFCLIDAILKRVGQPYIDLVAADVEHWLPTIFARLDYDAQIVALKILRVWSERKTFEQVFVDKLMALVEPYKLIAFDQLPKKKPTRFGPSSAELLAAGAGSRQDFAADALRAQANPVAMELPRPISVCPGPPSRSVLARHNYGLPPRTERIAPHAVRLDAVTAAATRIDYLIDQLAKWFRSPTAFIPRPDGAPSLDPALAAPAPSAGSTGAPTQAAASSAPSAGAPDLLSKLSSLLSSVSSKTGSAPAVPPQAQPQAQPFQRMPPAAAQPYPGPPPSFPAAAQPYRPPPPQQHPPPQMRPGPPGQSMHPLDVMARNRQAAMHRPPQHMQRHRPPPGPPRLAPGPQLPPPQFPAGIPRGRRRPLPGPPRPQIRPQARPQQPLRPLPPRDVKPSVAALPPPPGTARAGPPASAKDLLSKAALRRPVDFIVKRLYNTAAKQCPTCGMRFVDHSKLDPHMDFHFRRNQRLERRGANSLARAWFLTPPEWRASAGDDSRVVTTKAAFFAEPESSQPALASVAGDAVPAASSAAVASATPAAPSDPDDDPSLDVVADEDNPNCGLCGGKFENRWDEDEEEWRAIGSCILPGRQGLFHRSCVAQANIGSTVVVPAAGNSAGSDFVTRVAKVDLSNMFSSAASTATPADTRKRTRAADEPTDPRKRAKPLSS